MEKKRKTTALSHLSLLHFAHSLCTEARIVFYLLLTQANNTLRDFRFLGVSHKLQFSKGFLA